MLLRYAQTITLEALQPVPQYIIIGSINDIPWDFHIFINYPSFIEY